MIDVIVDWLRLIGLIECGDDLIKQPRRAIGTAAANHLHKSPYSICPDFCLHKRQGSRFVAMLCQCPMNIDHDAAHRQQDEGPEQPVIHFDNIPDRQLFQ